MSISCGFFYGFTFHVDTPDSLSSILKTGFFDCKASLLCMRPLQAGWNQERLSSRLNSKLASDSDSQLCGGMPMTDILASNHLANRHLF